MRNTIFILVFLTTIFAVPGFAENFENIPATPDMILGTGRLGGEEMASSLVSANPDVDASFAQNFACLYITEAAAEGVNHDVAFAQMCFETNFLQFDRVVTMNMNNFGGIGTVSADKKGVSFPSILAGVRAQIQHLKAFATAQPLAQKLVDPRYYAVRFGSAPSIHGLSGKWSADLAYGQKIKSMMDGIYTLAFGGQDKNSNTLSMKNKE
jgi:hypothetical protein